MIIPIVIGVLWLVAAGLYAISAVYVGVVLSLVAAPIPFVITRRMRRQAAGIAAARYLAEQGTAGRSASEATARLEELAPDGVTIDTDDVPNTGLKWMGLLTLGSIAALLHAALSR